MRIGVVGGGPGGLYFALLMKRADPSHQVTVWERNPPGATYGWGVVFSEGTLGELREFDFPTYSRITDRLVRWSSLDVRYRGEQVRSVGHGFSAISRRALLEILQERGRELGVSLEFGHQVDHLPTADGWDLLVGADGVNSRVRELHPETFRTAMRHHDTRYAWFGTGLVFDAFTFIFEETPHGLFQVHAYPFDGQTSTFIVECREEVWRAAGLDRMDEAESMAFCEEIFAEHLGGHELLSNRSAWIRFVTLRNQSWHHGKVVLLGDAAHTAHFTIGSGTKLAMEDAVALVEAFQVHPADREAAFALYELERQPAVERFQRAALESAEYFEHVSRYLGLEPLQFAFNLLTRSGRITHLELSRRDPGLVSRVDRRFAAWATMDPGREGSIVVGPPVLTPLVLGELVLQNRLALAPVGRDEAVEGRVSEGQGAVLAESSRLGPGLVATEMVAVSAEGRVTAGSAGIYRDEHTRSWSEVLERMGASGARVMLRLGHAGRRGATRDRARGLDRPLPGNDWTLLAPSGIPYAPWSRTPRPMGTEDMDRVREEFVSAARRAADAGFDLLALDLSDGYLLGSFLSSLSNRRPDDYGGDLEGRVRYPLEVLIAVRETWPAERPLAVRLALTDWVPGGITPEEAVETARRLAESGCSLVWGTAGHSVPEARPDYGRLSLVSLADRVRNEVGLPVMVGGNLTTFDQVNTVLAAGRADLCLLDPRTYVGSMQP